MNETNSTAFVPYIAYKGFDEFLKCRDMQFKIGETYSKIKFDENTGQRLCKEPRLCTADGFHYCNNLKHIDSHYTFSNLKNRYCRIMVLDQPSHDKDGTKSVTLSFKILDEISRTELNELICKDHMDNILKTVRDFQVQYPYSHIGGSIGLYLHGIRLERFKSLKSDFDVIMPFYQPIVDNNTKIEVIQSKNGNGSLIKMSELDAEKEDVQYFSSNDFDEAVYYNGIKIDVKIDPLQKYDLITYEGFIYKVSRVLTILEAKIRYAMAPGSSQGKHKDDIYEMIGKIK